jgi:hypothetical protein
MAPDAKPWGAPGSSSPGVICNRPQDYPNNTTYRDGCRRRGTYPEDMRAEGWYQDPYGLHTDRWFSDGQPTDLVRDGKVESRDAPPSATYTGPLVEAVEVAQVDGDDLRRADEAEASAGRPLGTGHQIWAAIETAASGGMGPGADPDPD